MNKKLIAVAGPTAIGKTAFAIAIAKHFDCEIISCDSRQFFKEMAIGTAVPSDDELAAVPHHFIQHKSIFDDYTVGDFEREAILKIDELFGQCNYVVMVGGSGLYYNAVLNGIDKFPEVEPGIRTKVNLLYETGGIESLQKKLEQLDPDYYATVDTMNPQRLMRALEVSIASGLPYSSFRSGSKTNRNFDSIRIGLEASREIIYERINRRVDAMIESGLIMEARELYPFRHLNALQTVGYKELFDHFEGKSSLDFAVSEIKKNTRRFAKRQLTWFRKDAGIQWIDPSGGIRTAIELIAPGKTGNS